MTRKTSGRMLNVILVLVAGGATPAAASATDDAATAYEQMINAEHWREASAAAERLKTFGDEALPLLLRGAEHLPDATVRRRCYHLLLDAFPKDERALRTIQNDGLADTDTRIRYMCAFHLGEHKVYASFRRLQKLLADPTIDELTRFAAAKSLAELGEPDGLPLIYDGLGSDRYMHRYLSNLGLKALTGKDVSDFGHDYGEGARVSGGVEARMARRPIEDAERRAARFRAIAQYCRWLRDEHPKLYKHLDSSF